MNDASHVTVHIFRSDAIEELYVGGQPLRNHSARTRRSAMSTQSLRRTAIPCASKRPPRRRGPEPMKARAGNFLVK